VPPVNHESPLAPLTARFRRVESISPIELTQMHALFSRFYENADLATFIKDLSEKSGVIMVREKNEAATIRGFSTIKQVELDDDGRPAIGVFSGDTILHPDYWGDRALKDGFVRYMLGVKARMPRTPIYWLLISKGYKTYLLLANNFVTYYPRHDKPSDPRLRGIVDQYCRQLFPRAYNPTKGIWTSATARSACVTRWPPSPTSCAPRTRPSRSSKTATPSGTAAWSCPAWARSR
jgi:hypothetical protein